MAERKVNLDLDPRDRDWLRKLPPEIDDDASLERWARRAGMTLEEAKTLPSYQRAVAEGRFAQ